MGHMSILLDEMGLDKMGLDEIGINHHRHVIMSYDKRTLHGFIASSPGHFLSHTWPRSTVNTI